MSPTKEQRLAIHPLTPERWGDFETLFGRNGACAVAPREDYPRLSRSKILAPVDDAPVWSVTCFFVRRDWRRRGLTVALLKEAARWVGSRGGRLLEGYPTDTDEEQPATFVYHGLLGAFRRAGFHEVARRSKSRPVVRRKARVR